MSNTIATNAPFSPLITGLAPASGPLPGGTVVAIVGAGLSSVTAVRFGTSPSAFSVVSDSELHVTTPPGSGTVDVTVVSPAGQSVVGPAGRFAYIHPNQPPFAAIQSISPDTGAICGGEEVAISGSGFSGAGSVLFGGIRSSFLIASDTKILARTPPHTNGAITISIGTRAGVVTTRFKYAVPAAPPTVSAVAPNSGGNAGGVQVVISGTALSATQKVEFAGRPAAFSTVSDSTVIAVSPAGRDVADIVLTTPTGAVNAATRFTHTASVGTPIYRVMSAVNASSAGAAAVAIDVNGEGAPSNHFGNLLSLLDRQVQSDTAFNDHSVDIMLRLDTQPSGMVLLDAGSPFAMFPGTASNGGFVSSDPLSTGQPISIALPLAALGLAKSGSIRIAAARVSVDVNGGRGQLNGVIPLDQIDAVLIPAMAAIFTDKLNSGSADSPQLLSQLSPAKDAQGKWLVTPANIMSSNVFAAVLGPDVQIFDTSGAYAPRKGGNTNDAMSFGLGFQLKEGPWK